MPEVKKTINKEFRSKLLAISLTCLPAWVFTYLALTSFKDYAWGLFVWLPLIMGVVTTLILHFTNYQKSITYNIPLQAMGFFGLGLLFFAMEGLLCIIMVAPLSLLANFIGFAFTKEIIKKKNTGNSKSFIFILLVSVPLFMSFESMVGKKEKLRSVTTTITIDAAPEVVWENVIAFPELNEPTELIFKTGIAYPISATIQGEGVGSTRYCNFSTGHFVEPITIWDEAKLLQFDVINQPEPMKEISPYNIHPNHLNGYWVSKKGQFKLTIKNGKTILEGTTWYINKIKPDFYWTIWSDHIVHKIHQRVLKHIKHESEKKNKNT